MGNLERSVMTDAQTQRIILKLVNLKKKNKCLWGEQRLRYQCGFFVAQFQHLISIELGVFTSEIYIRLKG